ncbi:hypothetical protein EVAR_52976_1 [Eumeta japonica]|uniref:Uncharacterized protein n=1 Tax=Eumeta variegata TaxID=151549 RepID=A0A4C1Z006_EUMVA|nr:hypothetical protein EVAR_52976_1 [Eumeta japonica]
MPLQRTTLSRLSRILSSRIDDKDHQPPGDLESPGIPRDRANEVVRKFVGDVGQENQRNWILETKYRTDELNAKNFQKEDEGFRIDLPAYLRTGQHRGQMNDLSLCIVYYSERLELTSE